MKKWGHNMKMNTPLMKMNTLPVGQASRLSLHSWKRRLPYITTAGTAVLLRFQRRDGCPTNRGEES
jgi:hypothetical protein